MQKILLLTALFAVSAAMLACGSAQESNPNITNVSAQDADANRPVNIDPANLPPGLDPKPIQPSGNSTPGIPAPGQANIDINANTNIPGIPSAANVNQPMKPGSKPTPGIPSQEEIKRQLNQVHKNANVPPPPPPADPGSTGARKRAKPVGQ